MTSTDRTEDLSSFWDEMVACQGDLARLLQLIARRVAAIVGEGSVLTVVSDDGGHLEPVAIHHEDAEIGALMQQLLGSGRYRIGEGIAGHVASDRQAAMLSGLAPTVFADLVYPETRDFAERHPIRALLIVPMVAFGELVGTLGVVRTESRSPYEQEDLIAVEAMAERAALAVADARRRPSVLGPSEYEAIYRHSSDGVMFTVPDGRILAANPAACEILQLTEAEICRRGRDGILVRDDPDTKRMVEERARTGRVRGEVPMIRGNGEQFRADISSTIFTTSDGELRGCVIFRDVTEQALLLEKLAQQAEQLEQQVERDPLTGLRNRRGFLAAANEAVAIARRDGKYLQMLFIDLDNLKTINDQFGHRAGDAVIHRLGTAIADETRDVDVSARLGGDEFVLLLFSATRDDSDLVIERLARSMGDAAGETNSEFSVGVAEFTPGSDLSLEELLDLADREMYQTKIRRRYGSDGSDAGP